MFKRFSYSSLDPVFHSLVKEMGWNNNLLNFLNFSSGNSTFYLCKYPVCFMYNSVLYKQIVEGINFDSEPSVSDPVFRGLVDIRKKHVEDLEVFLNSSFNSSILLSSFLFSGLFFDCECVKDSYMVSYVRHVMRDFTPKFTDTFKSLVLFFVDVYYGVSDSSRNEYLNRFRSVFGSDEYSGIGNDIGSVYIVSFLIDVLLDLSKSSIFVSDLCVEYFNKNMNVDFICLQSNVDEILDNWLDAMESSFRTDYFVEMFKRHRSAIRQDILSSIVGNVKCVGEDVGMSMYEISESEVTRR